MRIQGIPIATTGIPPYQMMYGRVPRRPLAILKESWCGERDIPVGIGGSVQKYLLSLKQKVEIAVDKAFEFGDKQEMAWGYCA